MYIVDCDSEYNNYYDTLEDAKAYVKDQVLDNCDQIPDEFFKLLVEDNLTMNQFNNLIGGFSIWYIDTVKSENIYLKKIQREKDLDDVNFVCGNYAYFDGYKIELDDKNKDKIKKILENKYKNLIMSEETKFINFCNKHKIKLEDDKVVAKTIKHFIVDLNNKEIYNDNLRIKIPEKYSIKF